ncbi:hypothetical protein D3C84_682440 [compost metagenome]
MTISKDQAALEQHIHDQIEQRDANVLADYAAYAADHMSEEALRNLFLAMLEMDTRVWDFMLGQIGGHHRPMHSAMHELGKHLEQCRAGFMELAATSILKEMQP